MALVQGAIKLSQLQSLRWGLHGPTQWNVPSGAFTSRKPMVCCEQKVNSSKSTSPDINSGVATTCSRLDTSALNSNPPSFETS